MKSILLSISLVISMAAFGQQISGTLYNIKGETLEGVNIVLEGTVLGTVSDKQGNFTLHTSVKGEYKLRCSYSGYQTLIRTINIPNAELLPLTMIQTPIDLNAVVVTASRNDQQQALSPIRVHSITAEKIKARGISYLPELLNSFSTSFEMQPSLSVKSYQLGGLGPQYMVFLVDGERLSGETKGAADLSRINPSLVERIEVVQGAASTLYGSNAIGGVVNVITKTPADGFQLKAGTQFSFFSDKANDEARNDSYSYVNWGMGKNGFSSNTALKYNTYDPYDLSKGTGVNGLLTQEEESNFAIDQRFNYTLNSKLRFSTYGSYYELNRDYALSGYADKQSRDFTYGLKSFYYPTQNIKIELSYHSDNNKISDVYETSDSVDYNNRTNTLRFLANLKVSKDLNFVLGSEYLNDKQSSLQNNFEKQHVDDLVFYTQGDYTILDAFTLNAGIRANIHSIYGNNYSPQVNALYRYNNLQFRAGYGVAFRAPSSKELFTKSFQIPSTGLPFELILEGNKDLQPETSEFFNGSIRYANEKVSLYVSGSLNRIDNLIRDRDSVIDIQMAFIPGMSPRPSQITYQYHNIEEAYIQSLEAGFTYAALQNFSFSGSYTYYSGQNVSTDEDLSDIRNHQAKLNIDYDKKFKNYTLSFNLFGAYYGGKEVIDVYTQERGRVSLPEFFMFNFMTTHTFNGRYTVSAGIKNLLDTVDENPRFFNFSTPGRMLVAGINITL